MRDITTKDLSKLASPKQLMELEWAPCRHNCPVHADVRSYLERAAAGDFLGAIDTIREKLPFAGICGRICHHPCEANCRRGDVDSAVAIREVKRFVAERAGAAATVHKAASQDKARVAIIGGGPAGMSAALELAKAGYRPTVFEKFPVAGGIPATAIPAYRLPREVVQMDIDWICAHGVELVTGVRIGKDKTLADLKRAGFAAVLIATGLAQSRLLPLPGADHPRVFPVLKFLEAVTFGPRPQIGQDVLVIGGGNVAVDAARSALRLGASHVRMMCLEAQDEMPAWEWERAEALEEGVTFINRRGPVEIVVEDGHITGVVARKVTRVFDADKRFNPQYDDADLATVDCDTVIMAIGQVADTGFVQGSDLKLDARGRLVCDARTHQTSSPGVFACGEIVAPPSSVVEACASGKRAARAIDLFLSGRPIALDDALPEPIGKIDSATAEKVVKVTRQAVPTEPPRSRKNAFGPIDHNYIEAAALIEARRCMSCGSGAQVLVDKCAACLTCARVCPFGIPAVGATARIESDKCQACGMCVAECPANAIFARGRALADLRTATAEALTGKTRHAIAYVCGHRASAARWRERPAVPGLTEIFVPTVAGIGVGDLLSAFDNGAWSVLVVACHDGQDRYPKANRRLRARVTQAQKMLREVGMDAGKLQLLELNVE
jgi:NADPH-dependent glutamate synthase beta subunit-like oxidoreductase/ferredoxin/coenzyme F420-reducing hydrogenase delta subunit